MTKDTIIDTRVKTTTLYLVPFNRGYQWSRFDNNGSFCGSAKVILDSHVVGGCARIKEIVKILNPMNIRHDLKPGMLITT